MKPCATPECKRARRPDSAYCPECFERLIDRALGVTAPVGDLPRWSPAA